MSSATDSPPESPLRNPSSIENATSRTPPPDGHDDDGISKNELTPRQTVASGDDWASEKPSQAGSEVKIPSTPSIPDSDQKPPILPNGDDTNTNDEQSSPKDTYNEDMGAPLPSFDWDSVRSQYTKAVQEVIGEEEELLEQFTKYTQVNHDIFHRDNDLTDILHQLFVAWAESAAERDNTKASKR